MKCVEDERSGRMMLAARVLRAGEVVLAEEAYCLSPSPSRGRQGGGDVCVHCGTYIAAHVTLHKCPQCAFGYCSQECIAAHDVQHEASGECVALQLARVARPHLAQEDHDTFQMVCLLLARCVAEGKAGRVAHEDKCEGEAVGTTLGGAVETVGRSIEQADVAKLLFSEMSVSSLSPHLCTASYGMLECLASNLHITRSDVVEDYHKLYDLYMRLMHKASTLRAIPQLQRFLPISVSRERFVSLCTAFQCNGFGVWSASNKQRASAIYVHCSFFNHSCMPNIARCHVEHSRVMEVFALRDIDIDEPLRLSYVSVRLPVQERRAKLLATYSFTCACQRCRVEAEDLSCTRYTTHLPPQCVSCKDKFLCPQGNNCYICPCCREIYMPT